ncbi:cupin domain-containing protein, partial [Streptomyces rochei]
MDVLAEALRMSGARGALGALLRAGGTWGLWLESAPEAALHVVSRGRMWLHVPGESRLEVQAGDAVLVSPGTAHGIAGGSSTTMSPCDRKATAQALTDGSPLRLGSTPTQTEVLGGFVWIIGWTRGRCLRCGVRRGRWSRSSRS